MIPRLAQESPARPAALAYRLGRGVTYRRHSVTDRRDLRCLYRMWRLMIALPERAAALTKPLTRGSNPTVTGCVSVTGG